MTYKFTKKAEQALEIANDIAMQLGHNYVGTEHILYGLVKEDSGVASKVLENQNVTPEAVLEKIEELIGVGEPNENSAIGFTPRTKRVIENAFREARRLGSECIGTEHLLIGIMREADSIAVRIMLDLNVNPQKLYNEIETLPEELTNQVINFIEYLKLSYADTKSDNSITIKNKLQKGIDDINTNKKCSLEDLFKNLENI